MVIVGTRRSGKSYKLIKESERTGAVILCAFESDRRELMSMAFEHEIKIKQPILFSEIDYDKNENVIIDNLDMFVIYILENKNIIHSSVGVALGQINVLSTNMSYDKYCKNLKSNIKNNFILGDD